MSKAMEAGDELVERVRYERELSALLRHTREAPVEREEGPEAGEEWLRWVEERGRIVARLGETQLYGGGEQAEIRARGLPEEMRVRVLGLLEEIRSAERAVGERLQRRVAEMRERLVAGRAATAADNGYRGASLPRERLDRRG